MQMSNSPDYSGGLEMIDRVQCPFCSCVVRRQARTTQSFMNRFTTHMMHYHWKKEEEE